MILEHERTLFRFMQTYALQLATDIPAERFGEQPVPKLNPPAWVLGHLAVVADNVAGMFGEAKTLEPDWAQPFQPGQELIDNPGDYPSKDVLLDAYQEMHDKLDSTLASISPKEAEPILNRPTESPRLKTLLPINGDLVRHVLTTHEATHLGQLSSWRRVIGMPRLF